MNMARPRQRADAARRGATPRQPWVSRRGFYRARRSALLDLVQPQRGQCGERTHRSENEQHHLRAKGLGQQAEAAGGKQEDPDGGIRKRREIRPPRFVRHIDDMRRAPRRTPGATPSAGRKLQPGPTRRRARPTADAVIPPRARAPRRPAARPPRAPCGSMRPTCGPTRRRSIPRQAKMSPRRADAGPAVGGAGAGVAHHQQQIGRG